MSNQPLTLANHIKGVHFLVEDFKCVKCEFKGSNYGSLKQHIFAVHEKINKFECELCE